MSVIIYYNRIADKPLVRISPNLKLWCSWIRSWANYWQECQYFSDLGSSLGFLCPLGATDCSSCCEIYQGIVFLAYFNAWF